MNADDTTPAPAPNFADAAFELALRAAFAPDAPTHQPTGDEESVEAWEEPSDLKLRARPDLSRLATLGGDES